MFLYIHTVYSFLIERTFSVHTENCMNQTVKNSQLKNVCGLEIIQTIFAKTELNAFINGFYKR